MFGIRAHGHFEPNRARNFRQDAPKAHPEPRLSIQSSMQFAARPSAGLLHRARRHRLGLRQTNAAVREVATEMRVLAEAQARTEQRMAWFAEQMLRGFDKVSTRFPGLEDRVDKLEQ
jgi:hypothetical protein